MTPQVFSFSLCVFLLAANAGWAQGKFDDLINRVPADANSLMVIDVNAALASPLAVREGWKNRPEADYVKRPLLLPPEADRMVLAAQMNPNRNFDQNWELGVLHLTEPVGMRSIARSEGGYVDQINGQSAVWAPSDAYFVSLESDVLGVRHPANRQAVSRWADFGRENPSCVVSDYLKNAAATVSSQTPIVMAVDLRDIVAPHKLEEALREFPETRDNPAKRAEWHSIIMGLRGVTLKVDLGDNARGSLQVDFSDSPQAFGKAAKTLVIETMTDYGAGIEDLKTWEASFRSNAILLEGELSKPGMRKIFSLLELPTAKFSTLKGETPAPDNQDVVAKATKAYYQSITTLLDDLRKEFKTNRDARRTMAPVYLERYGRKIDRLPILNVDEELLNFGASVSETLRSLSEVQRTGNVKAGVRKSRIYGAYQYSYGGYGYANVRPSSSVRSEIDRQEQGKARVKRFESWKQIEDDLADIRREMTKKYRVEF